MHNLQLAFIQTELVWESANKNRAQIENQLKALDTSTDLLILPEMFNTGFSMDSHKNSETMDGDTLHWMREIAERHQLTVTGSLAIKDGKNHYNRLIWMPADGHFQYYDKRHLFRMAGEHRNYQAGNTKIIVELNGWKVCPLICYDLRFPVWCRNNPHYDLMIFVANWPERRCHAWKTLLNARAIENIAYVVGVNRIGQDGNGYEFLGDSRAIDYNGQLLVDAQSSPGLFHTTLDAAALIQFRQQFSFHHDADNFSLETKNK